MKHPPVCIRESNNDDRDAIAALHLAAFGEEEGEEVSALAVELLDDPTAQPLLSLVAEEDGKVLGHLLFTAVRVVDGDEPAAGQILAPVGVVPGAQGRGVGGCLIRDGLKRLKKAGVGLVFVLGHIEYYPRFGFEPALNYGLKAPYPIPEAFSDAWMVQELQSGFLGRVSGTVHCSKALSQPQHWGP